eukprot:CAMPEP_0177621336 /NCGR_PEP_ID=MMETSP0419_2-20121207/27528_1 /TAXON_ID=582737 /ORGANISM="Tetraselmis sp., Strain GSL018" /LENGTH=121 /DNA_ID=CAMNT_0019121241 /DNA_START=557 /DNA_END=918 /DNA_ORIENTATION=+
MGRLARLPGRMLPIALTHPQSPAPCAVCRGERACLACGPRAKARAGAERGSWHSSRHGLTLLGRFHQLGAQGRKTRLAPARGKAQGPGTLLHLARAREGKNPASRRGAAVHRSALFCLASP